MKFCAAPARRLVGVAFGILWAVISATTIIPSASAQIVEVGDGGAGPVRAQHLTAEFIGLTPPATADNTLQIALSLTLEKHWHVYWINAGDSGEPPAIHWKLPVGLTAGPMRFPIPRRLPLGPLMDFGYENQVTFPVMLTVAPKTKAGKAHLDAHITWLVCSSVCIPGKAHLGFDVKIVPGPGLQSSLPLVLPSSLSPLPKPLPSDMSASATADAKQIVFTLKTAQHATNPEFFSFDPEVIQNAASQGIETLPDGLRFHIPRATDSIKLPAQLHALVKLSDQEAYEMTVPLTASAVPAGATTTHSGQGSANLFGALGLAFLGGLILNLMPCVFPVLFIKGLSLVQSSGEERKRLRRHGAMYTLGILVSFWIIVAVLLLLRAGGRHLGWGFQFQSPYFVAVMALLFFFLGLSLAGLFEIGLSVTSVGGELAQRSGYSGSFFTGVLATVVATPCTAPFMGAAIGFALSQSVLVTFAIFTLLAFGLAAPYVLLTWQPAWIRLLPRPGAWMEYLKQAVSIPIFIAVIWMVWVFAQVVGGDGVAALLAGMLITAIAGWILGHWPAKMASTFAAVVLLIVAIALPSFAVRRLAMPVIANNANAGSTTWQPFSPKQLAAYRAQGKPVFVDFSAAWCLSCQVNERVVLDRPDIEKAFRKNGVITVRADWTNYDDTITEALRQLGRSGVPTYALYSGGPDTSPTLLPEVLTPGIVTDALKNLQANTR